MKYCITTVRFRTKSTCNSTACQFERKKINCRSHTRARYSSIYVLGAINIDWLIDSNRLYQTKTIIQIFFLFFIRIEAKRAQNTSYEYIFLWLQIKSNSFVRIRGTCGFYDKFIHIHYLNATDSFGCGSTKKYLNGMRPMKLKTERIRRPRMQNERKRVPNIGNVNDIFDSLFFLVGRIRSTVHTIHIPENDFVNQSSVKENRERERERKLFKRENTHTLINDEQPLRSIGTWHAVLSAIEQYINTLVTQPFFNIRMLSNRFRFEIGSDRNVQHMNFELTTVCMFHTNGLVAILAVFLFCSSRHFYCAKKGCVFVYSSYTLVYALLYTVQCSEP